MEPLAFTIEKRGKKYCLIAKSTGKNLGCHDTREDAVKQETAIKKGDEALTLEQIRALCEPCAEEMEQKGIAAIKASALVGDEAPWLCEHKRKKEATEGDDESPTRLFLKSLYRQLQEYVPSETWTAAIRTARAHAGGVISQRRRKKKKHMDESDVGIIRAEDGAVLDEEENVWRKGEDFDPILDPKLAKDDSRIAYKEATAFGETCNDCLFFLGAGPGVAGACRHVEGSISPTFTCSLFTTRLTAFEGTDIVPLCASELDGIEPGKCQTRHRGNYGVFLPFSFTEAGEKTWIPYLPIPGVYRHPRYGEIIITKERNQNFIDNFRAGVYQDGLPLDAEHDTKVSGAMAWIEDMRMNDDGSVDAFVKWTERGAQALNEDRFRYISPEWFDEWTDPMSGDTYRDVAIGGALTTRPFFKEKALRPLVASEDGLDVLFGGEDKIHFAATAAHSEEEDKRMGNDKGKAAPPDEKGLLQKIREMIGVEVKASGDQPPVKAAVEPKPIEPKKTEPQKADEPNLKQMAEDLRGAREESKQLREEVNTLRTDAQQKRFTEIVMGKGEKNPHRWYGESQKNVAMLQKIALKFGESSEEFNEYVERENLHAMQLAESELFKTYGGQGAEAESGTALRQLEEHAKKLMEDHPDKFSDFDAAFVEAGNRNPKLKAEHRKQFS